MDIILASQSPRRRELLERMGLPFRIITPDIDERMERELPPGELVAAISAEKAGAVAGQAGPGAGVCAAHTGGGLGRGGVGKPARGGGAARMLSALSGRTHQVFTGLTVACGADVRTVSEETAVTFRPLTQAEIAAYVRTGEPMDKAGAYGIQGYGALLVEGIRGDYYNVMGLPVCRLGGLLRELGVDCLALAGQR